MLIFSLSILLIFSIRLMIFFKKKINLEISFRNYIKNIKEINFLELINGDTKKIDKFAYEGILLLFEILLFLFPFILVNRFIHYVFGWESIISFFLSLIPYLIFLIYRGK